MAKSTRRKSFSKPKPEASKQSKKVSEKEVLSDAEEAVVEEQENEELPNANEAEEVTSTGKSADESQSDSSVTEVTTGTTMPQANSVPEEKEEIEGDEGSISQDDQKEEESMPLTDDNGSDGGSNMFKKIIFRVIVLLVVFLLGMAVGGLIVYRVDFVSSNKTASSEKADLKESEEVLPTSTPTEVPVDLEKYKIEVLNGSEVKGAAGELNEELSDEGFNMLPAGNATSSSFAKTVVSAKDEVDKKFLKTLEDFLSKSYTLVVDQDLNTDSDADIVVTIGAE